MAGMVLPCPSCGAEVKLLSKSSVEASCAHCRGVLVVSTKRLELIGKLADLHEEATPLQLFVTGQFEGKKFQLIGRVQLEWEQGVWSEWYAPLADGREAWLAESQGFWMFTVAEREFPIPGNVAALQPGSPIQLGSEKWLVRDRKNARFVNFEGELPFKPALQGRIMTLDCGREGMPEAFATVSWGEVPKAGRYDVYRGKVRDFDAFNFQGLRKLEGW